MAVSTAMDFELNTTRELTGRSIAVGVFFRNRFQSLGSLLEQVLRQWQLPTVNDKVRSPRLFAAGIGG